MNSYFGIGIVGIMIFAFLAFEVLKHSENNVSDISAVSAESSAAVDSRAAAAEGSAAADSRAAAAEGSAAVDSRAAVAESSAAAYVSAVSADSRVNSAEKIDETEGFSIREISDDLFDRMRAGNTYKKECIVPREDLRYLVVLHKDKEGNTHRGEMVVHKRIAEDVLEIFKKLYDADYPIERMTLPDNYMADDETMMRDNNSSCFNFRFISHTKKISKHGLGMAVDINPLYNPYHKTVKNADGTTEEVTEPATGKDYLDRTREFDYKINKNDLCCKLFIEKGFEWGGDWSDRKDYQHFELPTAITEKYAEAYTKE